MPLRILSWNLNKRRDAPAQVAAIATMRPDVVVLQEVTKRRWPELASLLVRCGLSHNTTALALASAEHPAEPVACFVALASRYPLLAAVQATVPAADTVLCAGIGAPVGLIDVIGVHIPLRERRGGLPKLETQEGLLRRMCEAARPTIVCGDFNSPKAESLEGIVTPFAGPRSGRFREAELALMGPTNRAGMHDLFRARHGYDRDGRSWFWKNRGRTDGYRLDHLFASEGFHVVDCDYVHDWRERGLSDHAPIWADLDLA